jgi:hypothetical protein
LEEDEYVSVLPTGKQHSFYSNDLFSVDVSLKQDFARYRETCAIRDFDLMHQLSRLRLSKNVPDVEMEAITCAIFENLICLTNKCSR